MCGGLITLYGVTDSEERAACSSEPREGSEHPGGGPRIPTSSPPG